MQTPSVGRPCLTGYEIVEETKRYCRGNLVYKRGRGDGRWFEWIKQDEGRGKGDRKDSIDLLNKRRGSRAAVTRHERQTGSPRCRHAADGGSVH